MYKFTVVVLFACGIINGMMSEDKNSIFNSLFFIAIMLELYDIKYRIKNIGPWY